jgi:hypothetical protein
MYSIAIKFEPEGLYKVSHIFHIKTSVLTKYRTG